MFSKASRNTILTHISFVTLFLFVPTLAFVRLPGEPFLALTRVFIQDTLANGVSLCFFYLNYYILVEKFLFKRKYGLYILYTVLFLAVFLTLPHLIANAVADTSQYPLPDQIRRMDNYYEQPKNGGPILNFVFIEFRRHLFLFFTAVFFSYLLRTREYLFQLREEKLEAELSSLKSQINPHFLFNTLNSIYTLSVKKDDRAGEAIINLSGLMRYAINDARGNKITLEKEIDYLYNYIELQKARLGNTTDIRFECSGNPGHMEITPLILITFIENAFKYGVNPNIDHCIVEIILQVTGSGIQLHTYNKKVAGFIPVYSTGIGMKNTSERLKHLYPGKHALQVVENPDTYSVTLSLELI